MTLPEDIGRDSDDRPHFSCVWHGLRASMPEEGDVSDIEFSFKNGHYIVTPPADLCAFLIETYGDEIEEKMRCP